MFVAELDFSELFKELDRMKRRADDLSPTMAIIGEQMHAAVSDNFQTGGHGTWPGLAESTLARRRGTSGQILMDTGRLAGSQHVESGPDFAEVNTDTSYAVFHISDGPRKKLPLRNFYDLPEEVWTTAVETILNEVLG